MRFTDARLASRGLLSVVIIAAMAAALVPVVASPAGATVQGGTLTFQNQYGSAVDVWVESGGSFTQEESALATGVAVDVPLDAGNHDIQVCNVGSTDEACAGSSSLAATSATVADPGHTTATLTSTGSLFTSVDDVSPTAHGKARMTLRNAFFPGPSVSVCVAGQQITNVPASGVGPPVELTPGLDLEVRFYIGPPFSSCADTPQGSFLLDIARGNSFVFTIGPVASCSTACGQTLQVGEERPPSSEDTGAFCTVLVDADGIPALMQTTFGSIVPGSPGTYPNVATVEAAVATIQGILDAGDASVPGSIADDWYTAMLVRNIAGLGNAGYDLNVIPLANLQELVDQSNNPTPPPDALAAEAALADWFDANCADTGGSGALRFQNQRTSAVDVWVESSGSFTKEASGLGVNGGFDLELPGGSHDVRVCTPGSTNEDCAGASVVASTAVVVADGGNTTATLLASGAFFTTQEDTSPTAHGKARLVIRNAISGPLVSVCLNGQPGITNVAPSTEGAIETNPAQSAAMLLYIGGSFGSCTDPGAFGPFPVNLVRGLSVVITFSGVGPCSTFCGQGLQVGEERPPSSQNVSAFCTVLVDTNDIRPLLQATFGSIVTGSPGTYPTPAAVEAAAATVQGILDAGDASVPAVIADDWYTAMVVRSIGYLAGAGYDLNNVVPLATLQELVDQSNNPTPPPEALAAEAALADWFDANCAVDDNDGVDPATEDGAPNGGDGNNDGTPDSEQSNVTSLPAAAGGGYVTIASPDTTAIEGVAATDAGPLSPPVSLPNGIIGFTITGVADGAPVQVETYWPGTPPTAYYKYQGGQWIDFTAHATFDVNKVTLTLVNGGPGDSDGSATNGEITDPGGAVPPFAFAGFFSPVNNRPVLNSVKAGSAVPVKFSLGGDQGLGIFAAGSPSSAVIACDSTADVDGIEETVNAGSSGLQYDAASDRYTYVWKTQKSWAGTCRQLVLKLDDGTAHRVNFKLK